MQVTRYRLNDVGFTRHQHALVIAAAYDAYRQAYQPYSKFKVGCGILCADGYVAQGCNVETANYDGSHAEENAVGAMVAGGRRNPVLYACFGGAEGDDEPRIVASCGKCRQLLYEFAALGSKDLWMVVGGALHRDDIAVVKLADLLPEPFGPVDLGVDIAKYRR